MATSIINLTKTRILIELEEYKVENKIPPYFLDGGYKKEFEDSISALDYWKKELASSGYGNELNEIRKFLTNNQVDTYTEEKEKFEELCKIIKEIFISIHSSIFRIFTWNVSIALNKRRSNHVV